VRVVTKRDKGGRGEREEDLLGEVKEARFAIGVVIVRRC